MSAKQTRLSSAQLRQTSLPVSIPALPSWLPFIIFAIATVVFFNTQLFGDMFFWEDFVEYIYPVQTFAARHLASGTLPFWNPYTFNGMPFLADAQVGFFYPGNMLLALFAGDGHLPVRALEFVIILHFFLAQVSMYFLARHWNISSIGSVIAAVSYGFSGIMVCHVFHPMMVYHLALLPLILLHFDKGLVQRSLKHALFAGLLFGLVMLAGHPQTTLYIAFLLLLLTLWHGVTLLRSRAGGTALVWSGALAALAVVVAAGLFLVQYLPSSELASLSERNEITYEKATEGSLRFSQFLTAVVPNVFGVSNPTDRETPFYLEGGQYYYYWETAFYFGIVALVLGLAGIVAGYRSRVGGFLLIAIVFSALFALGSNGFLFDMFYHLPLFGSFRLPGRIMLYTVLAFTAFAGFGFDALARRVAGMSMRTVALVAGVPLLLALGVATGVIPAMISTPEQLQPTITGFGVTALVFTIITAVAVFLLWRGLLKPLPAGLILVVIAFTDLYTFGSAFNQSPQNPEEAYRMDPQMKASFTGQQPDSLFRVQMREAGYMAMRRNQGMTDSVMLYEGYNPLLLSRRVPHTSSTALTFDLLNIRYGVVLDQQRGTAGFAERPTAFPRARMVYNAVVSTPDKVLDLMKSGSVDFARTAVLEQASPLQLPGGSPQEVPHTVHAVRYEHNALSYKVTTQANGILALSEIWYPAWKVTVDGQAAELLRINYSLRGVAVPAGTHTVTMVYKSASFATGGLLSLATLLVTSGLLVWLQIREKKQPAPVS